MPSGGLEQLDPCGALAALPLPAALRLGRGPARARSARRRARFLSITGLLRISEVARLRFQDVVLPEDSRLWGVRFVVLALEHTNTGDDLSTEIRAARAWPLVRLWLQVKTPGGRSARLFPSAPELCAALALALAALGLRAAGLVWYSFRTGGALDLLNSAFRWTRSCVAASGGGPNQRGRTCSACARSPSHTRSRLRLLRAAATTPPTRAASSRRGSPDAVSAPDCAGACSRSPILACSCNREVK